jgi:hypothetical protein
LREDISNEDIAERKTLAQSVFDELSENIEEFSIESERVQTSMDNVVIGTSGNLENEFNSINASGSLDVSVNEV